jgi:hypothetical protein
VGSLEDLPVKGIEKSLPAGRRAIQDFATETAGFAGFLEGSGRGRLHEKAAFPLCLAPLTSATT